MPVPAGGEAVYTRVVQYESDGSSEPGDAVAIDGGQVVAADDDDDVAGIHAHGSEDANDPEDEDLIPVVIFGVTPASVEDGVSAGDLLGMSSDATPGELEAGESSDAATLQAWSDTEGEYQGSSAPDGTAFVKVS